MKRLITVLALFLVLCYSCSTKLNSNYEKDSAQWVAATFIENINSNNFEGAIMLLNVNPVNNGDISIEEFGKFVAEKITKNGTIKSIELAESPELVDKNLVRIDINFTYNDGSTNSLWVNVERVEDVWKMTTRGTLF